MCLLGLCLPEDPAAKLVLVSNRDEFHGRPTAPLHIWEGEDGPQSPRMAGGKDLRAGGTWLGFAESGRWAALTNIPLIDEPGEQSRGVWVGRWLAGQEDAPAFAQRLQRERGLFSPFNLVFGQGASFQCFSSLSGEVLPSDGPVFALANAPLGQGCPRSNWLRGRLPQAGADTGALRDLMRSQRRVLSEANPAQAPFLVSPQYGTRATTCAVLRADAWELHETGYGPSGDPDGVQDLRLPLRDGA